MPGKKNIALVLSSGGARGNAHIGAIQEFIARGYKITSISGTSMGAVIGGVYAAGKLHEFTDWMCSLHKMDVFSLMDFTLSSQGFMKANRVFNEMKKFIPDVQIEDLQIPFTAVSADLKKKNTVLFQEGSLYKALRASVAFPAVVTPLKLSEKFLVDGGLIAPIPIQFVKRHENDLLTVVNLNAIIPIEAKEISELTLPEKNNNSNKYMQLFRHKISAFSPTENKESLGFFDLITNSSSMMLSQISHLTLELFPPDILVNISNEACDTYDFYKANEMIEIGRSATAESLDRFEKANV
jgi:NTE family protein